MNFLKGSSWGVCDDSGPLLTRFGIGALPRPGGDKIGRRRMDTHFLGFKALGAEFPMTHLLVFSMLMCQEESSREQQCSLMRLQ